MKNYLEKKRRLIQPRISLDLDQRSEIRVSEIRGVIRDDNILPDVIPEVQGKKKETIRE